MSPLVRHLAACRTAPPREWRDGHGLHRSRNFTDRRV